MHRFAGSLNLMPQAQLSPPPTSLLFNISGKDAPGISAEVTRILAASQAEVIDIAQAVIHGLLSLSLLVEVPGEGPEKSSAPKSTQSPLQDNHTSLKDALIKDLLFAAHRLHLQVESREVSKEERENLLRHGRETLASHRYAITLISDRVTAESLHQVTRAAAQQGLNIDSIRKLSEGDFGAVEMLLSTSRDLDEPAFRKQLLWIARQVGVDIGLQQEGLFRRAKRLVVLDMDSTLIQAEVIDELARDHGVYEKVAAITHEAMSGGIPFDESLRRRVALLAGLPVSRLAHVLSRIPLTPGATELISTLKQLGYKTALISGGFTFVADALKSRLGIDEAFANELEVADGKLTGRTRGPIINAEKKAELLELLAHQNQIRLDQVVAVGDGANDLLMLEKAGLGIAFNAKPLVTEKADLAIHQKNLRSILYLLGLTGRDLNSLGLDSRKNS